jgi:hypothetical protein
MAGGTIAVEEEIHTWHYTKRPDGKISVTLDSNVWNFLFDGGVNLASELPSDEFAIFITREVEIETEAISATSKATLMEYIAQAIADSGIKTTSVFGFASEGPGPQRCGGFDQGVWQSQTEREFYAAITQRFLVGRREKRSQLTENEGDAAVAAQSFFSIVLTCESSKINGPLRYAREHGGAVLHLGEFDRSKQTLKEFIVAFYQGL